MFRPAKKAYLVLLIQVYKTACMKPQQWPPRNTPVLQSLATEYYDSIRCYVPHLPNPCTAFSPARSLSANSLRRPRDPKLFGRARRIMRPIGTGKVLH